MKITKAYLARYLGVERGTVGRYPYNKLHLMLKGLQKIEEDKLAGKVDELKELEKIQSLYKLEKVRNIMIRGNANKTTCIFENIKTKECYLCLVKKDYEPREFLASGTRAEMEEII